MAQTKQAAARPTTYRLTQRGRRLGLAIGCLLAREGIAQAGPPPSCRGVNQGALNVKLEATASTTRAVALKAGDTLTFRYVAGLPCGHFAIRALALGDLAVLDGALQELQVGGDSFRV